MPWAGLAPEPRAGQNPEPSAKLLPRAAPGRAPRVAPGRAPGAAPRPRLPPGLAPEPAPWRRGRIHRVASEAVRCAPRPRRAAGSSAPSSSSSCRGRGRAWHRPCAGRLAPCCRERRDRCASSRPSRIPRWPHSSGPGRTTALPCENARAPLPPRRRLRAQGRGVARSQSRDWQTRNTQDWFSLLLLTGLLGPNMEPRIYIKTRRKSRLPREKP